MFGSLFPSTQGAVTRFNTFLILVSDISQKFVSKVVSKRLLLQVGPVPPRIPQGYQIGPWPFVLMINDLDVNSPH